MATMQPAATVQRETNKVIEAVEGGDEDKNDGIDCVFLICYSHEITLSYQIYGII